MKVMDAATRIGLTGARLTGTREVTGTIDERKVLGALADLAADDPANADLYEDAASRVTSSRSAGSEVVDVARSLDPHAAPTIRLRYRSEMVDLFTDLAIDVGMRSSRVGSPV